MSENRPQRLFFRVNDDKHDFRENDDKATTNKKILRPLGGVCKNDRTNDRICKNDRTNDRICKNSRTNDLTNDDNLQK